jgi:hypothetical protein
VHTFKTLSLIPKQFHGKYNESGGYHTRYCRGVACPTSCISPENGDGTLLVTASFCSYADVRIVGPDGSLKSKGGVTQLASIG